jgi:hypothetical protein
MAADHGEAVQRNGHPIVLSARWAVAAYCAFFVVLSLSAGKTVKVAGAPCCRSCQGRSHGRHAQPAMHSARHCSGASPAVRLKKWCLAMWKCGTDGRE